MFVWLAPKSTGVETNPKQTIWNHAASHSAHVTDTAAPLLPMNPKNCFVSEPKSNAQEPEASKLMNWLWREAGIMTELIKIVNETIFEAMMHICMEESHKNLP